MEKAVVRRVNEWDGPAMLKIYAPYTGAPTAPEQEPPTLGEYIQRIGRYTYELGWLICEIDSVPAGFCFLTENRDCPEDLFSVEFQIYVKPECQRRGVGRALWTLMRDMLELGSRREVFAFPGTREARAFLKAMGFAGRPENGEQEVMRYALSPADPGAKKPVKPYLLENLDYEAARERAAKLIKE